ncbi:MAG: winged helix-turn-helix transcriptional regulator [Chloroflexi bacterium]|nr:winged helix-turn-helix transcriptional regulator [Chloroflexota bacterium]
MPKSLLDLYREHRGEIDALTDPTALFVLFFVNENGRMTRADLQKEMNLTPTQFARVIEQLNRAELFGTQADFVYITAGGKQFLADIGMVGAPPAPPQKPPNDAAQFLRFVGGGFLIALLAIGLTVFAISTGGLDPFLATATPTRTNTPLPTAMPTASTTPTLTVTPTATPTFTPTPTRTAAATSSPTPTLIPNVAGVWYHNFGELRLEQRGTTVSGIFVDEFRDAKENLFGTLTGRILQGKTDTASFTWTLDEKVNTFDGTYSGSASNFRAVNNCGARAGIEFAAGCSFAGAWINRVADNSNCAMTLKRIDRKVSGTYCNGEVEGTLQSDAKSNETLLSGEWSTGGLRLFGARGSFRFYLPGYDALQFSGNYNNTFEWCGWRVNSRPPARCLRSAQIP